MRLFEQRGFPSAQMEESGLVGKRQDGSLYDRFRNRLMFPIHNETGQDHRVSADARCRPTTSPST